MSWLASWICHSSWCGATSNRIEPYLAMAAPPVYPERSDEAFLQTIDPVLHSRYDLQRRTDNLNQLKFYPVTLGITTTQSFPSGNFDLDVVFSRSYQSVVFIFPQYLATPKIVKYSHNCGYRDTIHPLLIDAWFGSLASRLGIAPTVHFISPPRAMTKYDFIEYWFELTEIDAETCIGSSLRFVVMDLVDGTTLAEREGYFPLQEVLLIGKHMFRALKKLHNAELVHGNLREDHVLVHGTNEVKFVDFSSSVLQRKSQDLTFMSPWEIHGESYTARDDVFRAMRILASIMNGREAYIQHEKGILKSGGIAGLLRFKLDSNFFLVPQFTDPIARSVGYSDKPRIRAITRVIQFFISIVARMAQDSSDIPYDEIVTSIANIERRLSEEGPSRVRFAARTNEHRKTF
jgi:hypothetical protein